MREVGKHLRDQWMGALALFLVLTGGTAYAVTQIDRNSVKSKHIVNGQVKTQDLRAGAVHSGKVANESLTGADIDESSLDVASAYAHVRADGTLVAEESKNVLAVAHATSPPGESEDMHGYYCIDIAESVTPKSVVATLSLALLPVAGHQLVVTANPNPFPLCPDGFDMDVGVAYIDEASGTGTNRGFHVLVN